MNITQQMMDELTAQAKASPRLRMNLDLRNDENDTSQRMLNAIEPGSPLPIHRHQKTSETVVCLRGRLVEEYYQEEFRDESLEFRDSSRSSRVQKVQEIELSPNGPVVVLNIPAGQWHTVRALESGTVILEMKNGAYEPISDADILQIETTTDDTNCTEMDLVERLRRFMEDEARSCSMDGGCITPLYVYRMWGGTVPIELIEEAFRVYVTGRETVK